LFAAEVAEDTAASTTHAPASWSGGGGGLLLGEALAAEDGATLRGAKGDGSLLAALRADRPSFDARKVVGVAHGLWGGKNGYALGFASFAALGLVLELFIVKKQLFPGGKNKVRAAVDAGQYLILKFH
jgi:hypothetical protein